MIILIFSFPRFTINPSVSFLLFYLYKSTVFFSPFLCSFILSSSSFYPAVYPLFLSPPRIIAFCFFLFLYFEITFFRRLHFFSRLWSDSYLFFSLPPLLSSILLLSLYILQCILLMLLYPIIALSSPCFCFFFAKRKKDKEWDRSMKRKTLQKKAIINVKPSFHARNIQKILLSCFL